MRLAAVVLAAACGSSPPSPQPPAAPAPEAPPAPAPPPPPADAPPVARTVDHVDELFGQRVADPYRWMEGDANPERDAWLSAQGAYAGARLAALPDRDKLFARIRELGLGSTSIGAPSLAAGRAFYRLTGANEQLGKIVVRERDGSTRVLIDPNATAGAAGHHSIDNFTPSPDGKLLAYNMASSGGEVTNVHVLDVATGKDLPDVVERVWGEFAAAWLPDGKAFVYTQMAPVAPGADPMKDMRVRLHVLGTPVANDPIVLGHGSAAFPLEAQEFPTLFIPTTTPWVVAIASGARKDIRIAVARLAELDRSGGNKTPWRTVTEYADGVNGIELAGDRAYLLATKDAPNGRLLSVALAKPVLAQAKVEIPEGAESVLEGFAVAKDAIYVSELVSGHARLRRIPWTTRKPAEIALPYVGSMALSTDPRADGAVIQLAGWTHPPTQFRYDARTNALAPNGVAATSVADFSAVAVDEVEATAPDGTKVPLTILRGKDLAADGSHPALLNGYAAYGVSQLPSFLTTALAWIERGGVFAICHGRGGGEKGDRWYQDGVRANKLTGIRDFVACGDALVTAKWTSPSRLAAVGGSAGGILVGRAIIEKPALFAAVAIQVGMVNPLGILRATNGANQVAELGAPDTEAGFRQIHAIDPYLQLDPKVAYPAVLFTVGLHDGRVAPWMTAKMAAKLQAAKPARPVWIRIDADAGHGIGSSRDQVYAERADIWAFFLAQLATK